MREIWGYDYVKPSGIVWRMALMLALASLSACEDRDLYKFLVKPYPTLPCDKDNCGKHP